MRVGEQEGKAWIPALCPTRSLECWEIATEGSSTCPKLVQNTCSNKYKYKKFLSIIVSMHAI